ncbi:MAG: hypothetical protein KC910_13460, partial [Candidatus Eremiobacteraeota bacterium]|nr:hypothetical protein [Candidatus Eremiobacteraeota bacterium]
MQQVTGGLNFNFYAGPTGGCAWSGGINQGANMLLGPPMFAPPMGPCFGFDFNAMMLSQMLMNFMQSGMAQGGWQCPCHGQTGLYQPFNDLPYFFQPPRGQQPQGQPGVPGGYFPQSPDEEFFGPWVPPQQWQRPQPQVQERPQPRPQRPDQTQNQGPQPPRPQTVSPKDHPKTQTKNYNPTKDATDLYEAMKGGLTGLGTDEEAIFKALKGKSPEEIKALKENYRDHYDRDLMKDLKDELGSKDMQRVESLMKGEDSKADALKIRDATSGLTDDEEAVYETLKGKTAEQRAEIKQEYKKLTGKDLDKRIKERFNKNEQAQALSLLDGNDAKADAAKLQDAMSGMFGDDEEAVYKTLEGKSKEERAAIEDEYQKLTGHSLRERMEKRLNKDERARAEGLLDGKTAEADAARLHDAMDGWGTNEKEIFSTLEGKSKEEREAIITAYKDKYKVDLKDAFKDEMSGNDLEKANRLLSQGDVSDASKLKYAMEGWGTDEDAIKKVLEGKSKDEIAAIRQDYKAETGRDLDKDLKSELSGRDEFDATMAMKGKAESVEEALEQANERRDYERKGLSNMASRAIMDTFSDKGERLDANTDRANEQYERYQQALREGRTEDAQLEKQRLNQLLGYSDADVETYRKAEDSAAEAVGTVAATAASVAVVVGTAGTATPLVAAAMAAGAGAGTRVIASAAVKGGSYGVGDMGSDAAIGAVDGLATVAGMGAGKAAVAGLRASESALAGSRVAMLATEGAVDGMIGGGISAGGTEAVRDGTWDNGFGAGLQRVGMATGMGAGLGAVAGGGMAAAIGGAPALVRTTRKGWDKMAAGGRQFADALDAGGRKAMQMGGELAEKAGQKAKVVWGQIRELDAGSRQALRRALNSGDGSGLTGQAKALWQKSRELDNAALGKLKGLWQKSRELDNAALDKVKGLMGGGEGRMGQLGEAAKGWYNKARELDSAALDKLKGAFRTGDGS